MITPDYDALIQAAARRYNLEPAIFRRQLIRESGLNPNAVNKTSGAAGIAQFMPATAQGLGIDPMDPRQAIPAAALYMRQNLNRFGNDYSQALAAYNWGPGNVASKGFAAAPPETRNYVNAILGGTGMGGGTISDAAASAPVQPVQAPPAQPPALPLLPPPGGLPQGPLSGLADMFAQAAQQMQGRS